MGEKGKSKYPGLNDRDWLNRKYWIEGASLSQISRIVNCSLSIVFDAFERHNIERRSVSDAITGERNPNFNKTFTDEHKEKLSKAKIGKYTKEDNPFFGHTHTDKTKKILSDTQKGKHHSPETEFKKGNKPWNDGVKGEPNSFFGKTHTEEVRERIAESRRGDKNPSKRKEVRDKISETLKKLWLDPEFVAERLLERHTHPNKLETLVAEILDLLYPNTWKYNGSGEEGVTIAGMIPDFVHATKNEVVEVFGTYWHSDKVIGDKWKRSEYGRKAVYAQLGYRSIILWEDKIKEGGMEYIREEMEKE